MEGKEEEGRGGIRKRGEGKEEEGRGGIRKRGEGERYMSVKRSVTILVTVETHTGRKC